MFKNKNVLLFHVVYFLYFIAQAFSYCFLITFLTNIGYTPTQRSIFFTISSIFGAVVQFAVGYLCDRDQTVKKYANITFIAYVLFTIGTYAYTQKNLLVHLLLVLGLSAMMRVTNGILDSWCLIVDEDCKNNFGSIRAMGSIGWALGSQIGSFLIGKFSYMGLGIGMAVVIAIVMAIYMTVKDVEKEKSDPISFKDVGKLIANPGYLYALLVLFCLNMVIGSQDTLFVDKMGALKADESVISWYWTLSALVELPLFFFGNKVGDKLGIVGTCAFTTIMYGIKFIGVALVQTPKLVIAVSLLQFCTFPLLTIFSKRLIDEETADNMKLSGQQIGAALYSGFAHFLSPMVTGLVEENLGIDKSLYLFSSITLVSLAFLAMYSKNRKKAQ